MSEYLKGQKAWLDEECSWSEADKKSSRFRAGFNNAAKLYPNRRPKISVRSQSEMTNDLSMIKCEVCDAKYEVDDLLFNEKFIKNRECFKCESKIPLRFGKL